MGAARRRLLGAVTAIAALSGMLLWTPRAEAQPMYEKGFGNRDSFGFSAERVFGFQNQDFGDDGFDIDTIGFHPIYWGALGIWGFWESGLTFGSLIGATHFNFGDDDTGDEATLLLLRPRIGYALSQNATFGFWLRGGPTMVMGIDDDGDNSYSFGLGGEAYAVITPVPHVGILFGPHAEFHLAGGGDNEDFEYNSYGLTAGLLGEFW